MEEEKDFLLKRYEYTLKNFTDSNQAMIDFSKMALRGTMLLNGAAVIPIVYSKVEYLYSCAIVFGIGALLSACATSVAYLTQWIITSHCDQAFIYYPFRVSSLSPEEDRAVQRAHTLLKFLLPVRFFAMILVAGSLFAFGFGLIEANTAISSMQKKQEQTQLALPEQQKIQKEFIYPLP
jgi:hypothetical protein